MQYRDFGKIDFKPSALGFGAMRLPIVDNDSSRIDKKQAEKMLCSAIDGGVNYLDTAYVYHQGQSEVFLGEILKNGYRQKVKIATKLPIWNISSQKQAEKILEEELQRLQTDKIDFYLLHALNAEKWQKVLELKLLPWLEEKKKQGVIDHLGFSFHDELSVFKNIIDGYNGWEFCLMQYNFIDENFQAGVEGLKYAASKNMGVVIMEPLKGGRLACAPPSVQKIWDQAETQRTPIEWAFSWLWNQPEVSLIISGMNSLKQVEENLDFANKAKVNMLKPQELKLYKEVKKEYQKLFPVSCTNCQYCLPCPQGVNIPKVFEIYNDSFAFQNLEMEKNMYQRLSQTERAENCVACKKCEALCPQKIKISQELKKAAKTLTDNK